MDKIQIMEKILRDRSRKGWTQKRGQRPFQGAGMEGGGGGVGLTGVKRGNWQKGTKTRIEDKSTKGKEQKEKDTQETEKHP